MNKKQTIDLVLTAREQRYCQELQLAINNQNYLTIAFNIPIGKHVSVLTKQFMDQFVLPKCEALLIAEHMAYQMITKTIDAAGHYVLISLLHNSDLNRLKQRLIELENTNVVFKVVDFDIYDFNQQKITRQSLGLKPRQCYLCDQPAKICHRMQTHSKKAINQQINQLINSIKQ